MELCSTIPLPYKIVNSQWRVQEFLRGGGRKSERLFFYFFYFSRGGGPAQKIAEKMIFPTEKVANIGEIA